MSIKIKQGRAQPVARLIDQGTSLAPLMRKAQLLGQAQRHLLAHLPADLHDHVFVGGYHEGRLTLITDRAVWLTWLRFEQPRLLKLLHQLPELQALTGLTFKVRPIRPLRFSPQQPRQLSVSAAEQLEECAKDVSDPKLQKALQRLASHAQRSS